MEKNPDSRVVRHVHAILDKEFLDVRQVESDLEVVPAERNMTKEYSEPLAERQFDAT